MRSQFADYFEDEFCWEIASTEVSLRNAGWDVAWTRSSDLSWVGQFQAAGNGGAA